MRPNTVVVEEDVEAQMAKQECNNIFGVFLCTYGVWMMMGAIISLTLVCLSLSGVKENEIESLPGGAAFPLAIGSFIGVVHGCLRTRDYIVWTNACSTAHRHTSQAPSATTRLIDSNSQNRNKIVNQT